MSRRQIGHEAFRLDPDAKMSALNRLIDLTGWAEICWRLSPVCAAGPGKMAAARDFRGSVARILA